MGEHSFSVLIPDGGQSYFCLEVARCLGQVPGVEVHTLSPARLPPIRFSRHISSFRFIRAGDNDTDSVLIDAISRYVTRKKIDVILPVSEEGIRFAIRKYEALKELADIVPVPESETFEMVVDKAAFAAFLEKENFPHPHTARCENSEEFRRQAQDMRYPVLLKPRRGEGGKGIRVFENRQTLSDLINEDIFSGQYVIQSYIPGYDIDCSVICKNGSILCHTIQARRYGRKASSGIEFIESEKILEIVGGLTGVLEWSGVAHIDMRYDENDGSVKILEFNPRFWATLLYSLAAGVNFPYLACQTALGMSFDKQGYKLSRFLSTKGAIERFVKGSWLKGGDESDMMVNYRMLRYTLQDPLAVIVRRLRHVWVREGVTGGRVI